MTESNVTKTAKIFIDIFDVYDANILKISTILKNGFCDVAIIMTVSALEVLLTDLLEAYKDFWFRSRAGGNINAIFLDKRVGIKKEIRDYLKKIGLYDEFLRNYYVYQDQLDPETDSIYEILFSGEGSVRLNRLNFQNLNDKNGVRKAYMLFFNIDLMEMLDQSKNESSNKWVELNLFFDERHEIIHKGKSTSFSQEKIKDTLKSLLYMRDRLDEIVIPCYHIPNGYFPLKPDFVGFMSSYHAKDNLLS
jgi:hypothetical protein